MKYKFLILAMSFCTSIFVGYTVNAQSTDCDEQAFYDSLGQSESGGCDGGTGSGSQYDCIGPVINNGGMHDGDTPLGKYQFMPNTLEELGISEVRFVGNVAAQENAIRLFNERNNNCLNQSYTSGGVTYPPASDAIGTTINGVLITRSGLLGASHLSGCGGARRMIRTQGSGSSDQLGTSALGYAAKFGGYAIFDDVAGGECGGGVVGAADIFAGAQVDGLHDLIGCDPAVLEVSKARVDALQQQEFEAARAAIQQPTPVEQTTCLDQTTELLSAVGGIHSNPGGTISSSIGPFVQQPLQDTMSQFLNGNLAGSVSSVMNNVFADLSSNFLGGLGGGASAPNTDCDAQDEAWLIAQCIEMPELPSLGDILGGSLGELVDASADASGGSLLEQVCSRANGALGDLMNSGRQRFENAADMATRPLSDAASTIQGGL